MIYTSQFSCSWEVTLHFDNGLVHVTGKHKGRRSSPASPIRVSPLKVFFLGTQLLDVIRKIKLSHGKTSRADI